MVADGCAPPLRGAAPAGPRARSTLRRRPPVEDARGAKRAASGLSVWVARMEVRDLRGPMRERRQFLDRAGAALWPAYRQTVREFERVLAQRNAALEGGAKDLETWNERFVEVGARLRERRAAYVDRLRQALRHGF